MEEPSRKDNVDRTPRRRLMHWGGVGLAVAACAVLGSLWLFQPFGEGQQSEAALAERRPAQQHAAQRVPTRAEVPPTPDSVRVPEGMVYVPGGRTLIGVTKEEWADVLQAQEPGARPPWGQSAQPPFAAHVEPFFLEKHPVTVAAFRRFVEATDYETQAERFGNAGVFEAQTQRWRLVEGADWRHPRGPEGPQAEEQHPVTQVSWNDARAYCNWKERRLPTEVEWEHAARGARNRRTACPWGRCQREGRDTLRANTWQGRFPVQNTVADGYRYTSPVGAFGEVELGLTDMGGNVWEWTSSPFRPYAERTSPAKPPSGQQSQKVQRGGSFQCSECGGYHVFARSRTTPETSLFHVGFRCAKDAPKASR